MAPNPRVARAFRAMRDIGITEEKVKPVLKNLLKLYEKNWELIEEENYRALADAIFDQEETQAAEQKKKHETADQDRRYEEAHVDEEPERPLKRLRRYQEGRASSSLGDSSPNLGGTSLKQPKEEETELPEACFQKHSQDIAESSQPSVDNVGAGSDPLSWSLSRNKGKQPILPKPASLEDRSEPEQPGACDATLSSLRKGTDSDSVSPPTRPSRKGKEPLSPHVAPRDKKAIPQRSPHAVRLKEPIVEPGNILLPKQWVHNSHTLIKPKDEPFTDDMAQLETPIAVIYPEPLTKDNSSGDCTIREHDGPAPLVLQSVQREDRSNDVVASSSEKRTNCELPNILAEPSSNIELASLSSGEVKISLTCNSALGSPDCRMPSIDALLNMVEDKCLRSYKVLDPSFSVMKLMKHICECFLELATNSSNESQGAINVTPAVDITNQSRVEPCGPSNGSVNTLNATEVAQSEIPGLPSPSNGIDEGSQTNKDTTENNCDIDKEKEKNGLEHANSNGQPVIQQHQQTFSDVKSLHGVDDIAKGHEDVVISVVNEVNDDSPPSFRYIRHNVVFQNAYVNFSLARIGENCCSTCFGNCLSSSTPCACSHETGGDFAYTLEGLIREDLLEECVSMNRDPEKHCQFYCKECPLERSKNDDISEPCKGHLMRKFIKECWWKCGCSKQCGNRVVQRGINCNLQVFMTPEGKGWGLRTLEELPKGAFVCEYVGEILTNTELYERVSQSPSSKEHAYPVLLDADWGSEGVLKDEEALCLDATHYGNVARFINHRCFDSNLVEIPVEVETPDHHYYHLAFFTTRKVEALEELTWDYGIDFDDRDHPVKAFKCRCGSKFCRNIKRSSRSGRRR